MKRIVAIVVLILVFILTGSSYEGFYEDFYGTIVVGESYIVCDSIKFTFRECEHGDGYTIIYIDFESYLDKDYIFYYKAHSSENYQSFPIEYEYLHVNGEDRLLLTKEESGENRAVYYFKPLEKGTIEVRYNQELINSPDYSCINTYSITVSPGVPLRFTDTSTALLPEEENQ